MEQIEVKIEKNQLKPDKKQKKCTKVAMNQRISIIYDMLLDGYSRYRISQYASDNWGIGQRQVDDIIKKANILLDEPLEETVEKFKKKHVRRIIKHYHRCVKDDDKRTALGCLKELSDIEGIKTIKVEQTNINPPVIIVNGVEPEKPNE